MYETHWFYRKQGKRWIILFLVLFVNLLVILGIILALEPFWADINYYVGDFLGLKINVVAIIILILGFLIAYGGVLILLNLQRLYSADTINPHVGHRIAAFILIIFFNLVLAILLVIFGEEAIIVRALFENISIFIYLGIIIGLLVALHPILSYIHKIWKKSSSKGASQKIKALGILAIVVWGYGIGLSLPFLFVPVNVIKGDLPSKPKIIAHRGAAHLAPENTIEAGIVAVNFSADGWEIDVQLSIEGRPFLMHDDTLKRTTNVEDVFPGRENDPASSFTIAELKSLDAGSWFVDDDPYRAIAKGLITSTRAASYRNAKIPTLEEAVNFTRDNGLLLDVDFKGVPLTHPNHTQYFNICLGYLQAGGIDEKIWIATGNTAWLDITKIVAPNMTTALSMSSSDPLTVAEFLATGYDIINIHNGMPYDVIRAYVAANIPINTWTVDLSYRFSQLWCLGVTFVTTNVPQEFVTMVHPNWYLHTEIYLLFWIFVILLGFSFILTLKYDHSGKSHQ